MATAIMIGVIFMSLHLYKDKQPEAFLWSLLSIIGIMWALFYDMSIVIPRPQ